MRYKLIVFFSVIFLVSCSSIETSDVSFKNPDGTNSPTIIVEHSVKNATRQMGLMYRKKLETNRGMLFVFPDEEVRNFWMRNTYLALDIIFVSSDRKVVNIVEKATPLTDTQRSSEEPAKYVVEVNAGLAKTWGVVKGSELIGSLPNAND